MAKYTIELKDVIAFGYKLFDFPYDFYDESKREKFEESFIRHFYFREIGTNSVEEFLHYFRDKMETVFPYYNELFKANQIQYDVLNSYRLTETVERTIDNEGIMRGASSSRGTVIDNQTGNITENRTTNGTQTDNRTHSENGETTTTKNGTTETESTETTTGNTSGTQKVVKKFLDTPQGKLNLDNTDYLTNLGQDDTTSNSTENKTVTGESSTTTTENDKTVTEVSATDGGTTSTEDTTNATSETTLSNEQQNALDNNTRSQTNEKSIERHTLTRIGNIGVSPDALDIMKHLELQKIVKGIEKLFFVECEDLFMMVY